MRLSGVKLQKAIVDRARAHGYLVAHFRRSSPRPGVWVTAMDGDKGFPDLVLARPGRLIFMEVKGDGDRLSEYANQAIARSNCSRA